MAVVQPEDALLIFISHAKCEACHEPGGRGFGPRVFRSLLSRYLRESGVLVPSLRPSWLGVSSFTLGSFCLFYHFIGCSQGQSCNGTIALRSAKSRFSEEYEAGIIYKPTSEQNMRRRRVEDFSIRVATQNIHVVALAIRGSEGVRIRNLTLSQSLE